MKSEDRLSLLIHDLRTPLSAMRLTADLIGQDGLNERQEKRMTLLVGAIDALMDLTEDLIAKGEGNGAAFRRASGPEGGAADRIALQDLLGEVVDLFKARADAIGADLRLANGRALSVALSAPLARILRRSVSVLLDNALKYAGAAQIELVVEQADSAGAAGGKGSAVTGEVIVRVRDDGPGVSAEDRESLFSRFVRGRKASAETEGQGLGLYGARSLLREAGGDLRYCDETKNGACFEILLPQEGLETGFVAPDLASAEEFGRGCAHVLVIEDNAVSGELIKAVLESFNISCDLVVDVDGAMTLLDRRQYDGFVVDLHLKGTSGIAFAHAVRSIGADTPPVILVTAGAGSVSADVQVAAGISAVVKKPLDPAIFYDALEPVRLFREKRGSCVDPAS